MTLKGMRKADQQMILDTLGMDDAQATNTTTRSEPAGAPLVAVPESGPLGASFESNTRYVSLYHMDLQAIGSLPIYQSMAVGGHATKSWCRVIFLCCIGDCTGCRGPTDGKHGVYTDT